jgi:crotonobetainyl-CoA:carnitine CoA-transferase CaiB-like acyl-CoA transferase
MLLAELGAEVIKVERPGLGDDTRGWGPPFWRGMSTYFAAVNRGKRSLAIDLTSELGQRIVRQLITTADVVVENFRPGVARRLGVAYADVENTNPRLIYASINGFGSHGPRAGRAGTEVIVEAETGLMAMMGTADGPPVRFCVAMIDIATGMSLVSGVLAAMLERTRTGRGRELEFPLYSTAIGVLATVIASSSIEPELPGRRYGSGHPSIVPYSAFKTRDGWIVLGATNESMWRRLCTGLAVDALVADARSATNDARVRNREFVDRAIAAAVFHLTTQEIVATLNDLGVLVAPVRDAWDAITDPQVEILKLVDEDEGVKFARTPLAQFGGPQLSRAPALGEHTAEVLRWLGIDPREVAALKAHGVVGSG